MTRTEWRDRHSREIAEVAEALGVSTDHVAVVGEIDGGYTLAWYSPDLDDEHMKRATLHRDDYGVLRKLHEVDDNTILDVLAEMQ